MASEAVALEVAAQDKPLDTEKSLADFYQNEVLTDMTLVNPATKGTSR